MPTFSYSPTESVTFSGTGDLSVTDGATTTTYTKAGASKVVARNLPGSPSPSLETPLSQKLKPNGDLVHTYSDITKTPPVTTRVSFRPGGDVEILVTIGEDRTMVDLNPITGVRRTKIWKDPDPEPMAWSKTESPKSGNGRGGSAVHGSKSAKKTKKAPHRTPPAKSRAATRSPKKKSKSKARRR
ncbi:MAG TPA: hypothetical protein VKW04_23715 [Planctomycetota bacterium]|nr:hypothetical protein [Planctomycetota bacterium]